MSEQSDKPRTRLSYAHENPDLRKNNPLYERAGSVRTDFEHADPERAMRRDSFMVKRQQPKPVLRPSPSLAVGVDRGNFNGQWEQERRDALRGAKALRGEVLQARSQLEGHDQRRKQADDLARSGDQRGAAKKLFQTKRGVNKLRDDTTTRVRSFERAHGKL